MLEILGENESLRPTQFVGMNNYQNNGFSITLKYITSNDFRRLYRLVGVYCIKFLVKDCVLLQRKRDIFVQLSGESLGNLLNNSKTIAMQIKSLQRREVSKNARHNLGDLNSSFNRNNILYCLHSNGRPGLFRKSLLVRLIRFASSHLESPQRFDERDFPAEEVLRKSRQMDSNFRPPNQDSCAGLVSPGKENRGSPGQAKETPAEGKAILFQSEGGKLVFTRAFKEDLKEKPTKLPKRDFSEVSAHKKAGAPPRAKKRASRKKQREAFPNKTPEQRKKVFRISGLILKQYVFRGQKREVNRKTASYLEAFFARLVKKAHKLRFEKIFFHHCSNPSNFDYRVIKHAFAKLKSLDPESFSQGSLGIDESFRQKRREFEARRKGQANLPRDLISEIEAQDSPEKVIAVFLDALNKMSVEDARVFAFVKEVVRKLVPDSFWGLANAKVIHRYIRKMVLLKRFESFCVQDVLDDLNLFSLGFYQRKFNKFFSRQIRFEKVLLLRSLLKFVFEDLVMALLKFNFYITEKHSTHNKLFFYPKAVWFLISSVGLFELCLQNCARLPASNATKEQLAGTPLGKLRFVPKRNSLRPLMTFFKKFLNKKTARMERISKFLQPVKIVLRSVKKLLSGELTRDKGL